MADQEAYRKIEFPAEGATYSIPKFGVYEYGIYPRSSVLAGQQRRSFLAAFDTVQEALTHYPDAEGAGEAFDASSV